MVTYSCNVGSEEADSSTDDEHVGGYDKDTNFANRYGHKAVLLFLLLFLKLVSLVHLLLLFVELLTCTIKDAGNVESPL